MQGLLFELAADQVGVPYLPAAAFLVEQGDGVDDVVLEAFRPRRRDLHLHACQGELVVVADILEGYLLGLDVLILEIAGEQIAGRVVGRGLRVASAIVAATSLLLHAAIWSFETFSSELASVSSARIAGTHANPSMAAARMTLDFIGRPLDVQGAE